MPYLRPHWISVGEHRDQSLPTLFSPSYIFKCAAGLGLQEPPGGSVRLWELGCVFWQLTRYSPKQLIFWIQSRNHMYLPSFRAGTIMMSHLAEDWTPHLSQRVSALTLPWCSFTTISSGDRASAKTISSEIINKGGFFRCCHLGPDVTPSSNATTMVSASLYSGWCCCISL